LEPFSQAKQHGQRSSSRSTHFSPPIPPIAASSLDFEEIPAAAQPGFKALIAALYDDFHPRNLRLYVNTPVGDDDWDLKFMADHSDGLLLMNYDEHQSGVSRGRSPRRTGSSTTSSRSSKPCPRRR